MELGVRRAFKQKGLDYRRFRKVDLASVNIMDCRMERSNAGRTVESLYNLIRIKGQELRLQ